MKILSNDSISIGQSDKLSPSGLTFGLNPRKSLILSLGKKATWLSLVFDENSVIVPNVEKLGLIVKDTFLL